MTNMLCNATGCNARATLNLCPHHAKQGTAPSVTGDVINANWKLTADLDAVRAERRTLKDQLTIANNDLAKATKERDALLAILMALKDGVIQQDDGEWCWFTECDSSPYLRKVKAGKYMTCAAHDVGERVFELIAAAGGGE